MKRAFTLILFLALTVGAMAQQHKYYDESADAMAQLREAIQKADAEGRYVLCQVGGNWCPWCTRFAMFATQDSLINDLISKNFVYIHLNYSRDNKNPEAMKYLGNPARFGFPVFVIVTGVGKPIHIQNSAYLEEGQGYSEKKVLEFLQLWTPEAVNTLR